MKPLHDELVNERPTDAMIKCIRKAVDTCTIHALARAERGDDENTIIDAVMEELRDWQNG